MNEHPEPAVAMASAVTAAAAANLAVAFVARVLLNSGRLMRAAECSEVAPRRKASRRRGPFALTLVATLAALLGLVAPARAQTADPASRTPVPLPAELLARAAAPESLQRQGAIASLLVLGTPAAWNLILVMLQRDVDPTVRHAAALALGTSHDPDFAFALDYAARADPDASVREAAAAGHAAVAPFAKRPKAAAGFSVLCPGCGYFYLGQTSTALAFLGGTVGLLVSGLVVLEQSPQVTDGRTVTRDAGRATPLLMAAQNLWFYGIYASYRDARLARGDLGARYPVAREGMGDLAAAPFNPRVLKRPWVWAGLPLMLGAAVGASYIISRATSTSMGTSVRSLGDPGGVQFFGKRYGTGTGFALGEAYNASLFVPVGVGEEALFRGVVQAGLSETSLGLWGGWAVGSAIFGAVHAFNFIGQANGVQTAALAVPYLMVTGSYLGLVYIRTDFSLAAGTAVHFWYDFLLSTLEFIADPDHQPFVARVAMPF
jgi:membrane protease YdiL (CAAX protease family)